MECRLCGDIFYIRRGLLDLFRTKEEYICNACYKKYPIHLKYEAIQLDIYSCVILSMFDKPYFIDYNVFIKEYSKIYRANMNRKGFQILFFDFLQLTDDVLEDLDGISKAFEKNLIILCFSVSK